MKKTILCVVILLTVLCGVARADLRPLPHPRGRGIPPFTFPHNDRLKQCAVNNRYEKCVNFLSNEERADICQTVPRGGSYPSLLWSDLQCDKVLSEEKRSAVCKEMKQGIIEPIWKGLKCEEVFSEKESLSTCRELTKKYDPHLWRAFSCEQILPQEELLDLCKKLEFSSSETVFSWKFLKCDKRLSDEEKEAKCRGLLDFSNPALNVTLDTAWTSLQCGKILPKQEVFNLCINSGVLGGRCREAEHSVYAEIMKRYRACKKHEKGSPQWQEDKCDNFVETLSPEEYKGICSYLEEQKNVPTCGEKSKEEWFASRPNKWGALCFTYGAGEYQAAWEELKCEKFEKQIPTEKSQAKPAPAPSVTHRGKSTPAPSVTPRENPPRRKNLPGKSS